MKKNIIDEREVFEINEHFDVKVFKFGPNNSKIAIVDNFYKNPDLVRNLAITIPPTYNQNILAGVPGGRIDAFYNLGHLAEIYDNIIRNVFLSDEYKNIPSNIVEIFKNATFCVNVTQTTNMPIRAPHVDNREANRFASIIYLNTPEECQGGTSFYTYNGSQVGPDPSIIAGTTPEYINESCGPWEKIFLAEMKYNRMILYEQNILHTAYTLPGSFEKDVYRLAQIFFI